MIFYYYLNLKNGYADFSYIDLFDIDSVSYSFSNFN